MKELPVRKDIRLKGYDYSRAGYYFITICVNDCFGFALLTLVPLVALLQKCWIFS